jgi:hypothetical protein
MGTHVDEDGAFPLRDASVDGNGLNPDYRDASWDRIRDAVYRTTAFANGGQQTGISAVSRR